MSYPIRSPSFLCPRWPHAHHEVYTGIQSTQMKPRSVAESTAKPRFLQSVGICWSIVGKEILDVNQMSEMIMFLYVFVGRAFFSEMQLKPPDDLCVQISYCTAWRTVGPLTRRTSTRSRCPSCSLLGGWRWQSAVEYGPPEPLRQLMSQKEIYGKGS
jgi:hypothetical protein